MADQPDRDDLAQLRAELAAQRAVTVAHQARLARLERRRRVPARALPFALVALLSALLPLALRAADPVFSDLNEAAAVHRPNIQAIGNVGITTGFADPNDPTTRTYNPKGLVTREEMASFLARTAGLGGNPAVANAKAADNATTTGGFAPNALLRVARGGGGVRNLTADFQPLATITIAAPAAGFVLVNGVGSYDATGAGSNTVIYQLRDTAPGGATSLPNHVSTAPPVPRATGGTTFVFPVAGAGNRTYVLEALNSVGTSSAFSLMLTAVFIPFGYDGGTTLAPLP